LLRLLREVRALSPSEHLGWVVFGRQGKGSSMDQFLTFPLLPQASLLTSIRMRVLSG
jgi:hypothetical protein